MRVLPSNRTKKALAVCSLITATMFYSAASQSALIDRGNGLIYDDVLDVTWMQDANYMVTSGFNADGLVNHTTATNWVSNLSYQGYDDWPIPTISALNRQN
jgi:hypothetical protein